MNCLQARSWSPTLPLQQFRPHNGAHPIPVSLGLGKATEFGAGRCIFSVQASSGPFSSFETSVTKMEDDKKSEIYSNNMTQAMGAVLTYRHELGMNYDFILPNLIVGSCLQSPVDVDKLRDIGVKTIFCLQQNSDLEYFDVDIGAIQEYAKEYGDIEHVRAEIRDFNAFDLRMRLPDVVGQLHEVINRNGGVTYIHCTAGLGRAPAVALAYMFWILGYKLAEANSLLQSKRSCFPKLEAIKAATADILTGVAWSHITLTLKCKNYSLVEISGLDIGWGQSIPLKLNEDQGTWILERELPDGHYEYKYIVDGEWLCNKYGLMTEPNKDGHINNYIHVDGSHASDATKKLRKRLMDNDVDLTNGERLRIKQFLESEVDDA